MYEKRQSQAPPGGLSHPIAKARGYLPVLVLALLLSACATVTQPATITAQTVIDKFSEVGIQISNVRPGERVEGSPLPNSYDERLEFAVAEVTPRGGQVFVCASKSNCDALYEYFDMLKALAGPYTYQSPSGLVVAQLNSGLSPETAAKFEEVIKSLP